MMQINEHDQDLINIANRAHYVFGLKDLVSVIRDIQFIDNGKLKGQIDIALFEPNTWYLSEHKTYNTGSSERRAVNQLYRCRDFLYRHPLFSGTFGGGYYTFKNDKGLYEAHKVIQ